MSIPISHSGRIVFNILARRDPCGDKVTISAPEGEVRIKPYTLGDELDPQYQVLEGSSFQLLLPKDFDLLLNFGRGGLLDLQLDADDGCACLTEAREICVLCGMETQRMIELPNNRRICEDCWRAIRAV